MTAGSLILGGHSFISQLGTDPAPSETLAAELVETCLDAEITWFDTTYQPERVALGKALARLGRRSEATILAWNFFTPFGPGDSVGGHAPYEPHHLDRMLDELQTDSLDILIVHPVENPDEQARQEALAVEWRKSGRVRRLGTWNPPLDSADAGPYALAVAPCNPTVADTPERFARYKALGWETLGTSPFVRGWELQKRVEASGKSTEEIAGELLRWAAFHPCVDRLIVSMRRPEWIAANLRSLEKGPLEGRDRVTLKEFPQGSRVMIYEDFGWPSNPVGTIVYGPTSKRKLADGSEDWFYCVEFDFPAHDASPDGPYSRAEALSRDIIRIDPNFGGDA